MRSSVGNGEIWFVWGILCVAVVAHHRIAKLRVDCRPSEESAIRRRSGANLGGARGRRGRTRREIAGGKKIDGQCANRCSCKDHGAATCHPGRSRKRLAAAVNRFVRNHAWTERNLHLAFFYKLGGAFPQVEWILVDTEACHHYIVSTRCVWKTCKPLLDVSGQFTA